MTLKFDKYFDCNGKPQSGPELHLQRGERDTWKETVRDRQVGEADL